MRRQGSVAPEFGSKFLCQCERSKLHWNWILQIGPMGRQELTLRVQRDTHVKTKELLTFATTVIRCPQGVGLLGLKAVAASFHRSLVSALREKSA